jgi:GGDEF domain-containing protein
MISIRRQIGDLGWREDVLRNLAKYYGLAIRSIREYAVQIEPGPISAFRERLRALEDRAERAADAEEYDQIQASLRGELRDYRDAAAEQITRLRARAEAAAVAMRSLSDLLAANGTETEVQIQREIARLERASANDDIAEMRAEILAATESLVRLHERMKRETQVMVAQLQDEIHTLQGEMHQQERTLITDRGSGAWIRQKFNEHLERRMLQSEPFFVVLVRVDCTRLENAYSRASVNAGLTALVQRLRAVLEHDTGVGRWGEDVFAAMVDSDPSHAAGICQEVRRKLSGTYTFQVDGEARAMRLDVSVEAVERPWRANADQFYRKLKRVAGVMGGRAAGQ